MTYDDWKGRSDRDEGPQPEYVKCEVCGHPEEYFGGTKLWKPQYCDCPCCHFGESLLDGESEPSHVTISCVVAHHESCPGGIDGIPCNCPCHKVGEDQQPTEREAK